MAIRVYIIDDHPLIIDGLRLNFKSHDRISIVGSNTDARIALDDINARRDEIDVVLLDVSTQKSSGFDICRRLKEEGSRPYVIFMTFWLDDVTRMHVDRSEHDGVVLKNDAIDYVADVITRVFDGPRPVIHEALSTEPTTPSPSILTQAELNVLYYIAIKGLTSREIAEVLSRSVETVYKHRKNVMEKLGIRNVQGLVWYAMAIGLHQRPPVAD